MPEITKIEPNAYHSIVLKDRKNLEITGVKAIESFDSQEFLIETTQGWLSIKGSDLNLSKLDTDHGDVSIKGLVISIEYLSKKVGEKESVIGRLFK